MLRLSVQYASERPAPKRPQVRRWVRAALDGNGTADATLVVRFVDETEGRALNLQFRGRDYATNVLTFPYGEDTVEADIVVCIPVVESEAAAQGKPADLHCAHLIVHGTLHAAGHEHDAADDAAAMESLERTILARFGIPDPYRTV